MFTSSLSLLLADFMGIGDFHMTTTGLVVLIVILLVPEVWAWLALRYISNDYVGIVEKLWSSERLGAGRPDHRAQWRGRLPGGAVARWYPPRLVALAIRRAQGAAG